MYWLPLRKLSDLGDAHIFVEMFQHIDDSLQEVSHLTILPLSGHGSGTRTHILIISISWFVV